jgi:hypothetical protein
MTTIQEAIQRVPERLEDRLAADALGDLAGYNEDGELRGRIGKATISEESLWVAADQSCALTSEGVYWLRSKRMPDRPPAAPPSGNAIVVLKGRLSPEYDIISVGRCALSPICKPIRLPFGGMPAGRYLEVPERYWHVYFGAGVGVIAIRTGSPHDEDPWGWSCGFYPGSHQSGTAARAQQ